MEKYETIPVHIDYSNGKPVCMCLQSNKRCGKPCERDVVLRDRYNEWQSTFRQNKYGKT